MAGKKLVVLTDAWFSGSSGRMQKIVRRLNFSEGSGRTVNNDGKIDPNFQKFVENHSEYKGQ